MSDLPPLGRVRDLPPLAGQTGGGGSKDEDGLLSDIDNKIAQLRLGDRGLLDGGANKASSSLLGGGGAASTGGPASAKAVQELLLRTAVAVKIVVLVMMFSRELFCFHLKFFPCSFPASRRETYMIYMMLITMVNNDKNSNQHQHLSGALQQ